MTSKFPETSTDYKPIIYYRKIKSASILSRIDQSWLTRSILTAFLTLFWFERWSIYNRLFMSLDGSWSIGLQLARQQYVPFGSGVLFTYGPLSFGLSRLPIGLMPWQLLTFDIASMGIVSIFLWKFLHRQYRILWGLGLYFIILFTRSTSVNELGFYLFFISMFLFLDYRRQREVVSLVLSLLIGVIAFFLKANTGIITLISLLILAFDEFNAQHLTGRQRLLMIGLLSGFISLGAFLLRTDLVPYTIGSFHIVSSFNDVMYLESGPDEQRSLYIALLVIVVFISSCLLGIVPTVYQKQGIRWLRQNFALLCAVVLLLFSAFKYSFVRADSGHVGNFAEYSWMAFLLVYVYGFGKWLNYSMLVGVAASILIPLLMTPIKLNPGLMVIMPNQMQSYAKSVLTGSREPVVGTPTPLPATWRQWLQSRTVDAMPWDIADVYGNGLTYQPRPVLQTYQVTDGYLDRVNAQHYTGQRAPQAIWFQSKTLDNRYALADEPQTKLAIIERYKVIDSQHGQAIFGRNLRPNQLKSGLQWHQTKQVGSFIPLTVSDSGICLLRIKIQYKMLGYIRRLCHKPTPLSLDLKYQDGSVVTYRATVPLLENGMLIFGQQQPKNSLADYFLRTEQKGKKIIAVRVHMPSTNSYSSTMDISADEHQLIQG